MHTPTPSELEQQRPAEQDPSEEESSNADTSDDEARVSEILDRTAQTIAQSTTSLSRQGTPQTVPGALPTTPEPSTSQVH